MCPHLPKWSFVHLSHFNVLRSYHVALVKLLCFFVFKVLWRYFPSVWSIFRELFRNCVWNCFPYTTQYSCRVQSNCHLCGKWVFLKFGKIYDTGELWHIWLLFNLFKRKNMEHNCQKDTIPIFSVLCTA